MTWKFKTAFRDFKRIKEISSVLFKEGMGYYVHKLKLKHHLFLKPDERNRRDEEPKNIPQNLRKAMDKLGPTFVKIGQFLSLRPDLIPEEYCEEFSKLQDDVSGLKFSTIKKIVQEELKIKLDEVFSSFHEEPIASASIGQVHSARLLNGQHVVVKVQRPNIKPIIEADIDILYYLVDLAKKHIDGMENYNLKVLVEEFERYTRDELDYIKEGRNIDKFYENFKDDVNVIIPKVHWDYTTSKVLTMTYINGISIDDKDMLIEEEYDPRIIASNLADAFLRQAFEFGFVHADPHPANVFVCSGNKIALLDYGIVGNITEEHREQLTNLLIKIVRRDLDGVLNVFLELGILEDESQGEDLKDDLRNMIDEYMGSEVQQVNVPRLFREFLNTSSKYRFKVPKDLVLLGKAIITIEGVGRELDPEFNLSSKLSEYVEDVEVERIGFKYMIKNFGRNFKNYKKIVTDLPKQTSEILDRLKRGELTVHFKHKDLDLLEKEIDKGSNRVALSVLIGALILSSSLILNIRGSKGLAISGFVLAFVLSLFLVFSMYKERNIKV